jgi:anti-sigma factor RsiW
MQVDKFLMGHDERDWFVARVGAKVTTVLQAKENLKPAEVQQEIKRKKVKKAKRNRRRNKAFIRQGEWFFLPSDFIPGKDAIISRNEPLVRGGGGKPHIAQEACRVGGETVAVHPTLAPNGVSMDKYNRLSKENLENSWRWRFMTRDATVYVRGRIRHPDHKTIKLRSWHKVVANTEQRRVGGRLATMAFLD